MATANDLSILGQTSGTQNTTTNPQTLSTAGASASTTAEQDSVQPGTATDLLRSGGGQSLSQPALPTINLSGVAGTNQTSTPATSGSSSSTHFNAAYLVIPIVLVVVAAALFYIATRSIKKPTYY